MRRFLSRRSAIVLTAALSAMLILAPTAALTLTVEGNSYPDTVSVEGKTLKLVGAGLREKWFFDVYTMAAYSESGSCGAGPMVKKREVKYLRLDMLRTVDAEKMASTLKEAFDNNTPSNAAQELKDKVNTFTGYFKKACTKGTKLEFTYVPGKGTSLKQDGKKLGPNIAGKGFADILWGCYFSKKTCCKNLKKQILSHCK